MVDYGPLKPQERRIAEINRALRRKKKLQIKVNFGVKSHSKNQNLFGYRSRVRQRFLFEVSLVRL